MIALSHVGYSYALDHPPVLVNANLTIHKGEFVAIVGASGSGKSTLMNLIGLMSKPTCGQVSLFGIDTGDLNSDQLAALRNRHIGFVFQSFHLMPRLTVIENIMLPCQYSNAPKAKNANETPTVSKSQILERAAQILVEVGLQQYTHTFPSALSGGQKQRVAIARSLMMNPDLILADEPTGALDSVTSESVMALLRQLHNAGKTIVVITHDHHVANQADRILSITDGKISTDTHVGLRQDKKADSLDNFNFASSRYSLDTFVKDIKNGLTNMYVNAKRSLLTVAGLTIGIFSIVVMITLTSELKSIFRNFFDKGGGRNAYISFDWRVAEKSGKRFWQGVNTELELPKLNRVFEKYGRIEPDFSQTCLAKSSHKTLSVDLDAPYSLQTTLNRAWKIEAGRLFTPTEFEKPQDNMTPTVVLGSDAASKLFPAGDALGQTLTFASCRLVAAKVIGVIQPLDTTFNNEINSQVYVTFANLRRQYNRNLEAIPNGNYSTTWFGNNVKKYLEMKSGNTISLRSFSAEQQIEKIDLMMTAMTALTVIIGALCTIIGGIGVMNIMLVNMSERIREIGVLKALGAQSWQIRNSFLTESVLVSLMAGIFGIVTGTLVCNGLLFVASSFLPRLLTYHVLWNNGATFIALSTSIISGIIFGYLPAFRAGKMDVVDALRNE